MFSFEAHYNSDVQPAANGLHAARRSCVCGPRVFFENI